MCGRIAFYQIEDLKKRFKTVNSLSFNPSYNVSPGVLFPVITKNSPNKGELMKWGLVPSWSKDPKTGYKIINAREEDIENKPAFRKPIQSQRCIVPANGFFEWKRLKLENKEEKIPFYIKLKNEPIVGLAGIYDIWKDAEGKEIKSFAIITTKANEMMQEIHERMPVILKVDDEEKWLDKETDFSEILKLLTPYESEEMESYPVSLLVNNPQNNNKEIIKVFTNP